VLILSRDFLKNQRKSQGKENDSRPAVHPGGFSISMLATDLPISRTQCDHLLAKLGITIASWQKPATIVFAAPSMPSSFMNRA
jgi:hypothetical protein